MKLRLAFRLIALLLGGLVAVCAAELLVRRHQSRMAASDQLDPGLVQHDADLGWALTPFWTGNHRHRDFSARYTVNEHGFRADSLWPSDRQRTLVAVVGDSFTFGLGVGDDETFVHLLGQEQRAKGEEGRVEVAATDSERGERKAEGGTRRAEFRPGKESLVASPAPRSPSPSPMFDLRRELRFVNFSVPGYSTDQEVLLIEREVFKWKPEAILLMVYLGNDLFDNQFPVPIQVRSAKPFFEVVTNALVLRNVPVTRETVVVATRSPDLQTCVLGEDYQGSLVAKLDRRSVLFQLMSERFLPRNPSDAEFRKRFAPALDLFSRLIDRLRSDCEERQVKLVLGLLAGRSFVEKPGSLSARYQDFLRRAIAESMKARGVAVVDFAGRIKERHRTDQGDWFYPNDGHLTPAGHRIVADILVEGSVLGIDN